MGWFSKYTPWGYCVPGFDAGEGGEGAFYVQVWDATCVCVGLQAPWDLLRCNLKAAPICRGQGTEKPKTRATGLVGGKFISKRISTQGLCWVGARRVHLLPHPLDLRCLYRSFYWIRSGFCPMVSTPCHYLKATYMRKPRSPEGAETSSKDGLGGGVRSSWCWGPAHGATGGHSFWRSLAKSLLFM